MVALDTNVIVRYIVQDDPLQSAAATRIFEEVITEENHGFITSIAMCETILVLSRAYGQPREKLVQVIEALLKADKIRRGLSPLRAPDMNARMMEGLENCWKESGWLPEWFASRTRPSSRSRTSPTIMSG